MKRGQVTIFIIIAIVIIGVAATLFLINNKTLMRRITLPPESYNIYSFTEQCIKDIGESGAYLLAAKGGYIDSFNNTLDTEEVQMAYHMRYDDNSIMPDENFMENELSKFVADSLKGCILTYSNLGSYQPEFGKIDVKSSILDVKINFQVNYPITISIEESKTLISDFNADVPIRLGHLIDIKNDILDNIRESGGISLDLLSSYDAEINILPYNQENVIYAIYDSKSGSEGVPFFFNFALQIKSESSEGNE